jgi:hypothetical protein
VFDRLGAQVTAAGIIVANKLLPPITQAAAVLGDTLPGAFSKLGSILAPFGSFVGGALSAAWHLFGVTLSIVGAALGPVISLIDDLKTPLGAIATVAIGAVVAFKLFAAIPAILETVALKTMYARDAVVGFGVASKAMATKFLASSAVVVGARKQRRSALSSLALPRVSGGPESSARWAPSRSVSACSCRCSTGPAGASKEAAAAAKAYTEALSGGGNRTHRIIDTITKQLAERDVPEKIGS